MVSEACISLRRDDIVVEACTIQMTCFLKPFFAFSFFLACSITLFITFAHYLYTLDKSYNRISIKYNNMEEKKRLFEEFPPVTTEEWEAVIE